MTPKKWFQILFLAIISTCSFGKTTVRADSVKPEVGKPMPDFTLGNIAHFKSRTASLADFKGKWLFLDFWSTACSTCIYSFSKVNSFHKKFKDEMNWIMVGVTDSKYGKEIQQLYEKFRTKQDLEMPAAYDSVLMVRWEIHAVPHIIIVDPSGMVRFITDGRDMTVQKIRDLFDGKDARFYDVGAVRLDFDPAKTGVSDSPDKKDNLLYRSVLTEWDGERISGGTSIDRWITWPEIETHKGYNFSGVPLNWLYNHAYRGKASWDYDDPLYSVIYPIPVLAVKDSSKFQKDLDNECAYNYNLILPTPKITKKNVMRVMQDDLRGSFNFIASIESRSMPVWKLIAKPGALHKLETKGDHKFATPGTHIIGFTVINMPPHYLIGFVSFYIQGKFNDPYIPFVDETGLKKNFDLTLDADMTNIVDIRKELQKQGLDLVRGTKEMQVLVIRDSDDLR